MTTAFVNALPDKTEALLCAAPDCGIATAGVLSFANGLSMPNIFGMLLVYGLGLIVAATILNVRRKPAYRPAPPPPAVDPDLLDAIRARRASFERHLSPHPTGQKAEILRCLSETADETEGGFQVTNRSDMARLARPSGTSNADWYRAMAAYHMTRTDFSVLNRENKMIAAVEFIEDGPDDGLAQVDRMRHDALKAAGLPIIAVGPDTPMPDIAAWLRAVLSNHTA